MARRGASTTDATSTPEAVTPEAEAPESTTEGSTESPATETTEAAAPEVKFEDSDAGKAFLAAVETSVAERDESTGVLPEAALAPVVSAYRELDGVKPKNAAKSSVETAMLQAVDALDVQLARAYSQIKENLTAGSGGTKSSAPVDPTAAYVQKMASLKLATFIVSQSAPDGVEGLDERIDEAYNGSGDDVTKFTEWLNAEVAEGAEKPDAPEVSPLVRAAFKLAQGKASGGGRVSGGSGVRRDIAKHIGEAFADKASGEELTVAEIANFKSTEYGDDHPSQGAVSARLFPSSGKCTVEGVVPLDKGEGKVRRAAKA